MAAAKQKFLVPFNFSHKSEMALEFALKHTHDLSAHKLTTDIYLFHVFEASFSDYRRLDKLNEEYLERMKQIVVSTVERLAQQGFNRTAQEVHRRIANGKPMIEILRMAGGISADLIIMGAPEQKAFAKGILKAPCTTILVKDKDPAFVMV